MPIVLDQSGYETPLHIPLNDIIWDACGPDEDPKSRLIATLTIGGVHHHLEALAVVNDEKGEQIPVGDECGPVSDQFIKCDVAFSGDGPFETVEIEGRTYCLFMSPYRT